MWNICPIAGISDDDLPDEFVAFDAAQLPDGTFCNAMVIPLLPVTLIL